MVTRLTLDFDPVLQKVADATVVHTQVSGVSMLLPTDEESAPRGSDGARQGRRARGGNAHSILLQDRKRELLLIAFHPFEPVLISRTIPNELATKSRGNLDETYFGYTRCPGA
jgi:hypothetical protein